MRKRDDTMPEKIGLSRTEAANHIGISPGTFDRLVLDGTMPAPKRIFSRCVWDRREIDAAFAVFGSTPAPAEENEWA